VYTLLIVRRGCVLIAGGESALASPKAQVWKDQARTEFDRWAETYDQSVLNRLLFRRCYLKFIELILRHCPPDGYAVLLDIGSGTGTFPAMVAQTALPIRSIALDMAVNMCQIALQKAKHLGLTEKIAVVAADSEHLPFGESTLDVITCANSFHHYPHQDVVLEQMFQALKPGGRLIILDGFRDNVIGWFLFDFCVAHFERTVHHCSASRMQAILAQAGFADILQEKFGFWVPVLATTASKPAAAREQNEPGS